MMNTPLTAETLKHHFAYDWWKYFLALAAGIFLVTFIFSVTEPRVPEDRRVDFYICGYADEDSLNNDLERIRREEMPDMESMTVTLFYQDETYGPMQLMALVSAREGDLFLLPRDGFLSFASSETFLPLEDDQELMSVFSGAGIDLRRGWRTLPDSDETHLYGIPLDTLPGLKALCSAEDGFLAVTAYGGNVENTRKALRILCREMITAPEETAGPEPGTAGRSLP